MTKHKNRTFTICKKENILEQEKCYFWTRKEFNHDGPNVFRYYFHDVQKEIMTKSTTNGRN